MTSSMLHLTPASSHPPLSTTSLLPIAQLDPLLSSHPSRSIRAVVTLIWPYSSSKRSISFLLAEPDFRLRRNRGQVRVHFHGSAAKAVSRCGVVSGDVVSLGLEGAEWLRAEAVATPGKGIDWDLSFAERLLMELSGEARQSAVLDIDHPTPSPEPEPEPEVQAAPPPRPSSPQSPALSPQHLPDSPRKAPPNEWSSPAFLKRARLSSGSLFASSYDPFADADGFIEGKGRKRTRFWRESGQWRYMDRTPSPEKEVPGSSPEGAEDAMDVDEDVAGVAPGFDERSPLAEERGSGDSVPGNSEEIALAEELGVVPEDEPKSTTPNVEDFAQTGAVMSSSQETLQPQEAYTALNAVHDNAGAVLSSPEIGGPELSPQRTDHVALLESSENYNVPPTHPPSITLAQMEAIYTDESRAFLGAQEAPSSPRLRPVPSPSLPAVSPFASSFTDAIDHPNSVQPQMQLDLDMSGEQGGAGRDERVESMAEDPSSWRNSPRSSTPRSVNRYGDSTGRPLEPDTDEREATGAHPTHVANTILSAVIVESREGDEREGMDEESESETDEFGDDEREELYSSIVPRLTQFISANAVDGYEPQPKTYEDNQGNLHSPSLPQVNRDDETGLSGKRVTEPEDLEDSDQQSLSHETQILDGEADEEYQSDEEQYDEFMEGDEAISDQGESEEDEEESYTSGSSPVPQGRITTQSAEVIDLISDDDDDDGDGLQRAVQSEMAARQPIHFGSDGAGLSSFVSEPKADDFAEQWDRVIASQNGSMSGRGDFVEDARKYEQTLTLEEENEVYGVDVEASESSILQAQVPEGHDTFQERDEIYGIGGNDVSGEESSDEEQPANIVKETQNGRLETRQNEGDPMEATGGRSLEKEWFIEAANAEETQPARASAVVIPLNTINLPDADGVKQSDAEGGEGRDSVGPRVSAALDEEELPPSQPTHEAEERGTPYVEDDPRGLQHSPPNAPILDAVQTQPQLDPAFEGELGPAIEIRYPILPAVGDDQHSSLSTFAAEPPIRVSKSASEGKPCLQLQTPEATQQTFMSSQLSAISVHQDTHPTPAATQQDPPSPRGSLPLASQEQAFQDLTAPQEIPTSPPSLASPLLQGQRSFSPPESQLENVSSRFSVPPTEETQATTLTLQPTQITSSEPPTSPSSPRESLLQKLREIKSASSKKQQAGRDVVPDIISPWFTTKEVDQPEVDVEDERLRDHELRADAGDEAAAETQRISDGTQALPQNGPDAPRPPTTISPSADTAGITTSLSYFSLLSTLQFLFSRTVDTLAIVTRHQRIRKGRGPHDFTLSLAITDSSIPTSVTVTISRPFKSALPIVSAGDGILLRGFKVTSQKRKLLLQSTEVSSWAVFKSDGEVQIKGPPVEHGEGEAREIETLKSWWQELGMQTRREVAIMTQDEHRDFLAGVRSDLTENSQETAKGA
ncbi:hypothetical protein GP486_004156 [Trichoglossum hirsutum]|uniref:Telomeric single stranded DNA binding POT1/Cdc13 domain-containing protein n=1 Tax=Trichoglossum hirsutum TaxID=265104 RepID=A0A9P8LBR0_9PEZI|nr:hypothetical protein GP486_004156 [Trichoglossum hirsutum]